jgi:hypothetical protein
LEDYVSTSQLSQWFVAAEDAMRDARERAERDRDYYDNKQLTDEEVSELKKRGQPPVVINRIKRKIDYLTGLEKQQRTDPRAYPRTPNHEEAAEAATDALRYVAENIELDTVRAQVWKNSLIEGIGAVQIGVEQKHDGQTEISADLVPFDRFFADPHSSNPDFSDAKYLGMVVWQDVDDVVAKYGEEYADQLTAMIGNEDVGDTYDDKPRYTLWTDRTRNRVRVVQMWHDTPQGWYFCEFIDSMKLASGISPYVDEHGRPEHPFVCISAYVDRENNRYGVVREMIDPQDEINKRRSKALHLLTMRQVQAEKGAVDDVSEAKRQLSRPNGYIETNPGFAFNVLNTTDLAMGQTTLLQEAKSEIDLMGPNPSLSGKETGGQSGRAIQAQQQGGMIELGDLLDTLRQWDRRVYRMIWRRIKQFWNEQRWIRVTDDEGAAQFVGMNVPMTDPFGRVVGVQNPVAQMDVDIIIDDAPDTVSLQGETFERFMQILPVLAQMDPQFATMAVEMAPNMRNKQKILDALQGGDDPQAQAMQQMMQQQAAQLEMAGKQSDIENTQADTAKKRADAMKSITQAASDAAEASTPNLQ